MKRSLPPAAPAVGTFFRTFIQRSLRRTLLACTALCAATNLAPRPVSALPQNGTVTSGDARILYTPNRAVILEKSRRAAIDWSSFNIAKGEKVVFVQADSLSTVINQVLGGDASQIKGEMSANGMVILTNPNGILIGDTAKIRVGAIVMTTTRMSAEAKDAFMSGGIAKFDLPSNSNTASIVNRGSITAAQAGLVGMVAPGVENSGVIVARLGTVQMASGNSFSIDLYGDRLINLAPGNNVLANITTADGLPLKALVDNSGTITADGGSVILTASDARNILTKVINMDGIIQARSVGASNGTVILDGGKIPPNPPFSNGGNVDVSGTIDVSGVEAGQTGGSIGISGDHINLSSRANLKAIGYSGGGTIAVGTWESRTTTLAAGSRLDVSAGMNGSGGTVMVLGGDTQVAGTILARGGVLSGDGGMVETSGHNLDFSGVNVDTLASKGNAGSWLLDPFDLTIDTAAQAKSISSGLATGNVTLSTSASGASSSPTANIGVTHNLALGDIVINSGINWSSSTTLFLYAYHGILVNANLSASGASAGLVMEWNTSNSSGDGTLTVKRGQTIRMTGSNPKVYLSSNAIPASYTPVTAVSQISSATGKYVLVNSVTTNVTTSISVIYGGQFEGFGNSIPLNITTLPASYAGLFGVLDGSVNDLNITGKISSTNKTLGVGGLAGYLGANGVVTNDYVALATVTATGATFIGGLIGYAYSDANINNTYVSIASIVGGGIVGGILGYGPQTVTISSSTFIGGSIESSKIAGGLVGYSSGKTAIYNSYASLAPTIRAVVSTGGAVGLEQ